MSEERIKQLENALLLASKNLEDAGITVADWGTYASEYFQEKHKLDEDVINLYKQANKFKQIAKGGK